MDIDIEEFRKAKERLKDVVRYTPVEKSSTVSGMTGGEIYFKCENHQKTGSFKIRGASNKIAKMVETEGKFPVVTSSAGNHAQGVACAATKFGLDATVVMPANAPIAKIQATEGYGAKVVLFGKCYDDAYEKACEICEKENAKFIHPYDDVDVIAGQGTVGMEILESLPDVDAILVPAGGGGLLAGVSAAVKQINPKVKIYGVQAEGADAIAKSFEMKKRVTTDSVNTIADGIAVKKPGKITVELINKYADGILTVGDNEIADAILLLLERGKHVVESAGATTVAAVLSNKIDVKGKKIVCVLSGGNIDVSFIGNLIERGLSVRNRRLEFGTNIRDGSDDMIKIVELIFNLGGNIIDVSMDKSSNLLKANETRMFVQCEVGGKEHKDKIIAGLKNSGFLIMTDYDYLKPEDRK